MRLWMLPFWLLLLSACSERFLLGELQGDAGVDGGVVGLDPHDCEATGPLFDVGDTRLSGCGASQPSGLHRFALCSCDDVVSEGALQTDGFVLDQGAVVAVGGAGSVGAQAQFFSELPAGFGGSLWLDGEEPSNLVAPWNVGGDLRTAGRITGSSLNVAGQAWVNGDVQLASLAVGGGLTVPPGAQVSVDDGALPQVREAAFDPRSQPCDCPPGLPRLDAALELAAQDNDNAAIGLQTDGLSTPAESLKVSLPCGRYYVDHMQVTQPLTLTVTGRVALFVGRGINTEVGGSVVIDVQPGAELDLVLGGSLAVRDELQVGTAASAARTRIYATTEGSLFLDGPTTLGGTLYAPRATLSAMDTVEIFGAAFVGRWFSDDRVDLHHHLAAARSQCGPPSCSGREDCDDRLRCVDGTCLP